MRSLRHPRSVGDGRRRDRSYAVAAALLRGLWPEGRCGRARPTAVRPADDASPAVNLRPVMRRRLVEQPWAVLDRTALRAISPAIEPPQPRTTDRGGAHRPPTAGDGEIASDQARVTQSCERRPHA